MVRFIHFCLVNNQGNIVPCQSKKQENATLMFSLHFYLCATVHSHLKGHVIFISLLKSLNEHHCQVTTGKKGLVFCGREKMRNLNCGVDEDITIL